MGEDRSTTNGLVLLSAVGAAAWLVPGGGYFVLGDKPRGLVVLVTIALTFLTGLYVGSIGVVDTISAKPWYIAQVMNSPVVYFIGQHVAEKRFEAEYLIKPALETRDPDTIQKAQEEAESIMFRVCGRPAEIGQIYTSISGLLNLLCIVNAMYLAHRRYNPLPGGAS